MFPESRYASWHCALLPTGLTSRRLRTASPVTVSDAPHAVTTRCSLIAQRAAYPAARCAATKRVACVFVARRRSVHQNWTSEFAIGWRLNAGVTLRVGERVAELTRTSGQPPAVVVRDGDVDSRDRTRLRSYAGKHNLPLDCGLVLRDLTKHPESQDPSRVLLNSSATVDIELSTNDQSSAIDPSAVSDVPEHADVQVVAEQDFLIGPLLQKLRSAVRPPAPPAVVVTRRSLFTDTYLEADRLVEEWSVVGDDGALSVMEVLTAPLSGGAPPSMTRCLPRRSLVIYESVCSAGTMRYS